MSERGSLFTCLRHRSYQTAPDEIRAWLAIRVKRYGERLSWWLQP